MGAGAVEVTSENFRSTVEKGGIVFIDWWAPWCGPCRAFGPIFEKAALANPDIVFGKVNTDDEQALSSTFEITSIPTLMIFRDNVLVFSQPGSMPAAALDDLIRQVRALDMNKVHEALAEQQRAGKGPASA